MIESNILAISNAMFKNKKDWKLVTDEQKEQFFFIINRYFSKKYPDYAQLMNKKQTNKIIGMDLWFEFMKDKPYPKWFWSKAKEDSSKKEFTDKELFELQKKLDLKKDEIDFLIKHHKDEVIEELEYLKKSTK